MRPFAARVIDPTAGDGDDRADGGGINDGGGANGPPGAGKNASPTAGRASPLPPALSGNVSRFAAEQRTPTPSPNREPPPPPL